MNHIYICRRCGDRRLPPPHDWAGEQDRFPGAAEPQPGGLGGCGDLHDWVPATDATPRRDTVRVWILGAPDPEMAEIERLLVEAGERIAYALAADGQRVHPGNAYRAVALSAQLPDGATVYAVECGGPAIPAAAVLIDHHRPDDPGYGRPPAEFLPASSIGQVIAELAIMRTWREETPEGNVYFPSEIPIKLAGWRTLLGGSHHDHYSSWSIEEIGEYTEYTYGDESGEAFVKEMVDEGGYYHVPSIGWVFVAFRGSHELGRSVDAIVIPDRLVFCAAADHCLAAAYRGECPGVDPDALMRWRAESRAQFQRRPVEAVLADVERAREALMDAPVLRLSPEPWEPACGVHGRTGACWQSGGPDPSVRTDACYAMGDPLLVVDMRGRHVPELPEASARDGVCFIASLRERDGRIKVVCQSGTPEQIRAFMEVWAPAQGLTDIYGDPARGFAGGYVKRG